MPSRVPYARPDHGLPMARPRERAQAEAKAERDAFYSSARWRRFRRWFLGRHPVCEDCLARGEVTPATIPHHVRERLDAPALAYVEGNLVALCSPCHTRRHKGKSP